MSPDDRAVTDVLAFSLIFTVMILSVGILATVGFASVGSVSESEQLQSADRSMGELADQLTGIADHEAPVRSTEIRMGGASISVLDAPTMTLQVNHTDEGMTWNDTFDLGAVEYRLGDTRIIVSGGAVFWADDDNAVMRSEPPFLTTENKTRLNIVRVSPLFDDTSVMAGRTLHIQSHYSHTRLIAPDNRTNLYNVSSINVSVGGDDVLTDAWDDYFDDDPHWEASGDGWVLTEPDGGAVIRSTNIRIQFIR